MEAVGVIDDLGIVAALHKYSSRITPQYRAAIVDEFQDLGTLELEIIRKLVVEGENDLFFCGDSAQTIYTKSADYEKSGIKFDGRQVRLNQNYRNSRQILAAAHSVLTRSIDIMPKGAADIEILPPEFASFTSPLPLLLKAENLEDELKKSIGLIRSQENEVKSHKKYCIAICGYSHTAVESIGRQLSIPVLSAFTEVGSSSFFLSDLEQTKGFEFDVMVVCNCNDSVMPHPNLPQEESFRDLCRLYVAMTRAKTQLVISYSGEMSSFLTNSIDNFLQADFIDYAESAEINSFDWPSQLVPNLGDLEAWGRDGKGFLKSRDAVGLDRVVQDEILEHVTGREKLRRIAGRERQVEWRTFGSFAKAIKEPRTRHLLVSEESWANLNRHLNIFKF